MVSVWVVSVTEDREPAPGDSHKQHPGGTFHGLGPSISRCLQRAVKSCFSFLGSWPQSCPSVQPPLLPPVVPSWAHPCSGTRNTRLQVQTIPDLNPSLLCVAVFLASLSHRPGPLDSLHKGNHERKTAAFVYGRHSQLWRLLCHSRSHCVKHEGVGASGGVVIMAPLLGTGLPRIQSIPCSLFLSRQWVFFIFYK